MYMKTRCKKIFSTFVLFTLITLISGCVGLMGMVGSEVQAYEGSKRTESELSTLISSYDPNSLQRAFVRSVDGKIYGDDALRGWPNIVKILPGKHTITVKCMFAKSFAKPSLVINVEAGKTYQVKCNDLENKYADAYIEEVK